MKSLCLVIICLFFLSKTQSQEITIYGQRSLWHADSLCDIEFTGCNYTQLNEGSLLGYAHHPNGRLWLVLCDQSSDYRKIKIFEVQKSICKYSLLYTITLPYYWSSVNAVNIDHLGRVYLNITEYDSINNTSTRTLSRISNPAQPTFERLFVYFPNQNIFEVHFSEDKVYIPEIRKPFIYVFDTNFVLLDTIIMQKHIWGLTSVSYGCDSIITYAAHLNITTQDYVNSVKDTTMYISRFDLETGDLTPICNYWMGDNRANTQLTSPLEFLSSDPECDLLIDLDRDNSSGVYPYDYLDSTDYCTVIEALVCDQDVYIHTSVPLDSIRIVLSGISEYGYEKLIAIGLPGGVNFTQLNDSTYILTSTAPTDSLFQKALLALRYQHSGFNRTGGERYIILQGYNAIKDGVKVKATISISGLAYAGQDVTLLICTDTIIQDVSILTEGQPGGYWWPSFNAGGSLFNSQLDIAASYLYVINDPICGNDTATVMVNRDASAPVDLLGNDLKVCMGDTVELAVQQNVSSILWDDGSISDTRILSAPGDYWVAIETSGGCIYRDTLNVSQGQVWLPSINASDPKCGQSDGQIAIDSLEFEQNLSVMINGVHIVSPTLSMLSQGTYQIISVSKDGCELDTMVTLTDLPSLTIDIDTQVVVIKGLTESVVYEELNHIAVTDILFDPIASIKWVGSSIEVFGEKDNIYEITFIDENGCTDIHYLHVKVEKEEGIYLPNIFRPGSTTGNAIWKPSISEAYKLEVLRIYDRWGNLMHQSTSDAEWDGTSNGQDCPTGVFVYQLILTHLGTKEQLRMTGDISLMR